MLSFKVYALGSYLRTRINRLVYLFLRAHGDLIQHSIGPIDSGASNQPSLCEPKLLEASFLNTLQINR
jgi:hypothetical protein